MGRAKAVLNAVDAAVEKGKLKPVFLHKYEHWYRNALTRVNENLDYVVNTCIRDAVLKYT